ncbi:MAG: DMT family transporter [Rhizobiaceae bacterium]
MTRARANLVLLLAGAMWGMGFVAQSSAMEAIGPMVFIALRFLVATLSMLPAAIIEGRCAKRRLSASDWMNFAFIGVLLFAGMTAQQIGLETTTVTNSGFLTGLYVVMVPFISVLLFRQWPHAVVWPAALLALTGIWLLSGGSFETLRTGDWLTMLCAFFWALQVIYIGRGASEAGRPVTLAVMQFAICAALAFACAIPLERIDLGAIRAAMPEILYAGIFSGGIAFTLQAVGQRYTTAPQAAIFLSSESVFAALFGAIFLGERVGARGFVGCVLIFVAILGVEILPAIMAGRRVTSSARL